MAFSSSVMILRLLFIWVLLISPVYSLSCTSQKFTNNHLYNQCVDLPTLSSYLHWTYDSSNSSLSIVFIAAPSKPEGWVSWAINPTGKGMVGCQALVGYQSAGKMVVKTYNVKSYSEIVPAKLSFDVWGMSGERSNGVMRIFAKIKVPEKTMTLKQVWQVGPSVTGDALTRHDFSASNLNAMGTLKLDSDGSHTVSPSGDGDTKIQRKNIHGILNVVSWGILFPTGVIIARYLRTFPSADPAWFYLHISCQITAYALGVAGWGTGVKLGSESEGIVVHTTHRNIGIFLFCLATIQMFALLLRPKKDHKYRLYWNIYHHTIGYSVIVLGIINVFKGFDILQPEKKWKSAYIVVIAVLGATSVLLEAITWTVVLRRRSKSINSTSTKPYDNDGHLSI